MELLKKLLIFKEITFRVRKVKKTQSEEIEYTCKV